jgi:hypothetical protein
MRWIGLGGLIVIRFHFHLRLNTKRRFALSDSLITTLKTILQGLKVESFTECASFRDDGPVATRGN